MQEQHMIVTPDRPVPAGLSRGFLLGSLAALLLIIYGVFRTPTTSLVSVSASALVLVVYALIGWFIVPRLAASAPALLSVAQIAGVLAGTIFAAEIILEYVLLPTDNTRFGVIEFGLVFAVYACAGGWLTLRGQRLRDGVLGAVMTALISSLIWCLFIFALYYLFAGTARQAAVFRAEGTYDDFQRSGMTDLNAFIMEDFLGASFFHLLLGPLLASALGSIGGVVGLGIRRFRR
jgi:hypothetical protein